jgi:PAS domain S-box-containing protein
MPTAQSRKLKVAAAWTVIALGGLAAGTWNFHWRDAQLRTRLTDDANRFAVAFSAADLAGVRGEPNGGPTAEVAAVHDRLNRIRAVDPRVRSVRIYRAAPASSALTLIAQSPPRADRDELGSSALETAALLHAQAAARNGQPVTDGPRAGLSGETVTTYVLISDASKESGTDRGHHVLHLDVDAAGWSTALWAAGFRGAFYLWTLLGLPFAAWLVIRRHNEQGLVIRNLSEAMEQSHSAIMIVDLESRIEYANRGLCQQIGYTCEELIGRNWRDFHVPQTSEAVLASLVDTVRSGKSWEGDWLNRRKDGTIYHVRGVVTPVKHDDGALACFVAVFDDVSETKTREAELREARDAALAGDRAKGHFLATMSHEVRTPLNGIVGFTSLLLDTPLNPEQREYVQTIRMSTEALIQLTGDILDFARIESGKLKLDPLACDPRDCVEDALDLLAAKAAEKNLELLHHVGPDVPAAVVVDGGRLRQVLVNLIGNAVKFTERGEIEARLVLGPGPVHSTNGQGGGHGESAGGMETARGLPEINGATYDRQAIGSREPCSLTFSVRDTGAGISREHHAKLFRPFSQVDESTTRRHGGTGLGLAICRNLVELMGGSIHITSDVGHGSTFSFTIPVPVAAPLPPVRDLGGMRVALAIESKLLRRELADLLRRWKAEVVETMSRQDLATTVWEVALVEVSEKAARDLAAENAPSALPADKCLALIPISLPNELRTVLRSHFRLLANKPVHHEALFGLLSGSRTTAPPIPALTHFGFRVLVVEDNAVNQRLIQRVLSNLGCTPILAENGRDAVTMLMQHAGDFDLVLLDLHMPEMDGIAALQEMRSGRAGSRAQTMWVIALTADAREQQRASGMAAGLNDYLTKPLKIAELEAALRKFRTDRLARRR